jgi:hypothetical protein
MSLFIASGNAPELFEPIDEALSTVTFLVNLAIEPTPRLCWAPIGEDSGPDQSTQGGRSLVQDH